MTLKPASNTAWDTNGTNCAADTTAGHKTDGYALNEIPTSTELNRQFRNLSDHVVYLETRVDETATVQVPITVASYTGAVITVPATISASTRNFTIIGLKVGDKITAIRARIQDSATGPTKLTVALFSAASGVASGSLAASAQSAGSGAVQTISATGITTVTVADLTDYVLQIAVATGAASCNLYALSVDVQR